jgi:hypothetical protein
VLRLRFPGVRLTKDGATTQCARVTARNLRFMTRNPLLRGFALAAAL